MFTSRICLLACTAVLSMTSCTRQDADGRNGAVQREQRPLSLTDAVRLPRLASAPRHYLLVGVAPEYVGHHTRAEDDFGGLTDSMLLVRIEPEGREVRILSIPRDTRVSLPSGHTKINAALKFDGADAMIAAVASVTGIEADGYVLFDTHAVREVVDAVGGVNVHVPFPMTYHDTAAGLTIDLAEGLQHLNGAQAEGFVRYRDADRGDIARVERQQAFLLALKNELFRPATLLRLDELERVLARRTRGNLTDEDYAVLLGAAMRRPVFESHVLPGDFAVIGGLSYWEPDGERIASLVSERFRTAPDP